MGLSVWYAAVLDPQLPNRIQHGILNVDETCRGVLYGLAPLHLLGWPWLLVIEAGCDDKGVRRVLEVSGVGEIDVELIVHGEAGWRVGALVDRFNMTSDGAKVLWTNAIGGIRARQGQVRATFWKVSLNEGWEAEQNGEDAHHLHEAGLRRKVGREGIAY